MTTPTGETDGAGVGPNWVGARAMAGGKGYVSGTLGQVHYREVGSRGRVPFLLIHQTPIGFAQFVDVQPELALAGRCSIAVDNPGYGFSDPLTRPVTIVELADHLDSACARLQLPHVIVVGHHTGAAIAAAFAARHPSRTAGLVMHGTPLYDARERAERLARPPANLVLSEDGSHLASIFRAVGQHAGIDAQTLTSVTWATLGTYLAGASSPVYTAVFSNDMTSDIEAVKAPTLILTDRGDVLHAADRRVKEMRPDFELREFSTGGSFALMREPRRWARELLAFADARGL